MQWTFFGRQVGFPNELAPDATAAFAAATGNIFFACGADGFAGGDHVRWGHHGTAGNGGSDDARGGAEGVADLAW